MVTVGITGAVEAASWGSWRNEEIVMAPRGYVRAVRDAGAIAVVLPPDPRAVADPGAFLDRIDALLLAGGADVDPRSYGAEPHETTVRTWPERDEFEIAVAREALQRELPLLGVCRGFELLNVATGGTLDQHLPASLGSDIHRRTPGVFDVHSVRLEPGSLAARAVGAEHTEVKSHHHQGAGRLGEGLVATGWAEDGVIEAIEDPRREFALGVLWHPEEDEASRVVASLAQAAAKRPLAGRTAL